MISLTTDTQYKYSKHILNDYYLQDRNVKKILKQFPDAVKINLEKDL